MPFPSDIDVDLGLCSFGDHSKHCIQLPSFSGSSGLYPSVSRKLSGCAPKRSSGDKLSQNFLRLALRPNFIWCTAEHSKL